MTPVLEKLRNLLELVMERIDSLIERMPPGVQPSLKDVERIIEQAVEDFLLGEFKDVVKAQLLALVVTLRSEVQHDDTELA